MTIEESKALIVELQEKLNTLQEENKILTESVQQKDIRIKEVEEYNQKIFLKATASKKEEKEDEKFTSKLLGEYANLLNDEELNLLKELEGDL